MLGTARKMQDGMEEACPTLTMIFKRLTSKNERAKLAQALDAKHHINALCGVYGIHENDVEVRGLFRGHYNCHSEASKRNNQIGSPHSRIFCVHLQSRLLGRVYTQT